MTNGKIDVDEEDLTPSKMTTQQFNSFLIRKIHEYWKERGHCVRVWAEPVRTDELRDAVWEIRSDLVNGIPKVIERVDGYGQKKRTISAPTLSQAPGRGKR